MKSLLLMSDDGMSGLVWLQMARSHLQAGKTVLAITDPQNTYEAIGTGDGLPGYNDGLTGHPGFRTATAGLDDAEALLQKLKALEADTVVMWNMSPFEFTRAEPRWREVLSFCAQSPLNIVFASYYSPSLWGNDLEHLMQMGSEIPALAHIDWDYIAGGRILSHSNVDDMRQLFSGLAGQLNVPTNHSEPTVPGLVAWQIVDRTGSYEVRRKYAQIRDDIAAIPEIWDSSFDRSTLGVGQVEADAKPSIFNRLVSALMRIV
jgi:hypothetical protein